MPEVTVRRSPHGLVDHIDDEVYSPVGGAFAWCGRFINQTSYKRMDMEEALALPTLCESCKRRFDRDQASLWSRVEDAEEQPRAGPYGNLPEHELQKKLDEKGRCPLCRRKIRKPRELDADQVLNALQEALEAAPPFVASSPTSRQAAAFIARRKAPALLQVFFYLLAASRTGGRTDDEGAGELAMNPNTYRPRRISLRDAGLVVEGQRDETGTKICWLASPAVRERFEDAPALASSRGA